MKRSLCALLIFFVTLPTVFAADPTPPSGTSVEVLEKKFREESKDQILEQENPKPAEVEVEKPAETEVPGGSFYADEGSKKMSLETVTQ